MKAHVLFEKKILEIVDQHKYITDIPIQTELIKFGFSVNKKDSQLNKSLPKSKSLLTYGFKLEVVPK